MSDPDKPKLDLSHGLTLDARKGYKLRVTISRGRKLVGKRITIQLGTRDELCARLKKDLILHAYSRLGITITTRPQTRRKNDAGELPEGGEQ